MSSMIGGPKEPESVFVRPEVLEASPRESKNVEKMLTNDSTAEEIAASIEAAVKAPTQSKKPEPVTDPILMKPEAKPASLAQKESKIRQFSPEAAAGLSALIAGGSHQKLQEALLKDTAPQASSTADIGKAQKERESLQKRLEEETPSIEEDDDVVSFDVSETEEEMKPLQESPTPTGPDNAEMGRLFAERDKMRSISKKAEPAAEKINIGKIIKNFFSETVAPKFARSNKATAEFFRSMGPAIAAPFKKLGEVVSTAKTESKRHSAERELQKIRAEFNEVASKLVAKSSISRQPSTPVKQYLANPNPATFEAAKKAWPDDPDLDRYQDLTERHAKVQGKIGQYNLELSPLGRLGLSQKVDALISQLGSGEAPELTDAFETRIANKETINIAKLLDESPKLNELQQKIMKLKGKIEKGELSEEDAEKEIKELSSQALNFMKELLKGLKSENEPATLADTFAQNDKAKNIQKVIKLFANSVDQILTAFGKKYENGNLEKFNEKFNEFKNVITRDFPTYNLQQRKQAVLKDDLQAVQKSSDRELSAEMRALTDKLQSKSNLSKKGPCDGVKAPETPKEHDPAEGSTPNSSMSGQVGAQQLSYQGVSRTNFKGAPPHTNEDRLLAGEISVILQGRPVKCPVFGMLDGHGGTTASDYVQKNISKFLQAELKGLSDPPTDGEVSRALQLAFLKCNEAFLKAHPDDTTGTTAAVAVIIGNTVYAANAGDSRILLVGSRGTLALTQDMEPSESRRAELERRGDGLSQVGGQTLHGSLGVAASLGDLPSSGVTARPEIAKITLNEAALAQLGDHPKLILACDGTTDAFTSEEIQAEANKEPSDMAAVADRLAVKAQTAQNLRFPGKQNEDDVSHILVDLSAFVPKG